MKLSEISESHITQNENEEIQSKQIIQLAYGMALGQHRLFDLYEALGSKFGWPEIDYTSDLIKLTSERDISELSDHFDHAMSLLKDQGRKKVIEKSALRVIETRSDPAFLVDEDIRIVASNKAAKDALNITDNKILDPSLFDDLQYKSIREALNSVSTFPRDTILRIFETKTPANKKIRLALTHVLDQTGKSVGYFSAISVNWQPDVGARFQNMLGLTNAELDIVKALITSTSLRELAETRRSKLSTVRNQTKRLLAKLSLNSQTELACLYSGFSKYSFHADVDNLSGGLEADWREPFILTRPDGRKIDYDIVATRNTNPIPFLPSLLGGRMVTEAMYNEIVKKKTRLVMPWRPHFYRSDPDGPLPSSLKRYSDDLVALLDKLHIEKTPIIGHMSSVIYAFAVANYYPDRITKIISIAGALPSRRGPHLQHLDKGHKLRLFLMAKAPKIGRFVTHALLARIDAGYDIEFAKTYLKDSPPDLGYLEDQKFVDLMRRAYDEAYAQGYEGFVRETELMSIDWHDLVDNVPCPVTYIVGEHEPIHSPAAMKSFVDGRMGSKLAIVPNTGHFVCYQRPDIWLNAALDS